MKKLPIKKIIASLLVSCFAFGFAFSTPVATTQVHAASAVPGATVQAHIISYVCKIENRKLYKRLYNYSRGEFIGDWIFVRNLTDEDLAFWGLI